MDNIKLQWKKLDQTAKYLIIYASVFIIFVSIILIALNILKEPEDSQNESTVVSESSEEGINLELFELNEAEYKDGRIVPTSFQESTYEFRAIGDQYYASTESVRDLDFSTSTLDLVEDQPDYENLDIIEFSRTDDPIKIEEITSLNTDGFYFEFNTISDGGLTDGIISFATEEEANTLVLYNSSNLSLYFDGKPFITGFNISDGDLHNIVVTWDGVELKVSVDGEERSKVMAVEFDTEVLGGALYLGNDQDSYEGGFNQSEAFSGKISELTFRNYSFESGDSESNTLNAYLANCDEELSESSQLEDVCDVSEAVILNSESLDAISLEKLTEITSLENSDDFINQYLLIKSSLPIESESSSMTGIAGGFPHIVSKGKFSPEQIEGFQVDGQNFEIMLSDNGAGYYSAEDVPLAEEYIFAISIGKDGFIANIDNDDEEIGEVLGATTDNTENSNNQQTNTNDLVDLKMVQQTDEFELQNVQFNKDQDTLAIDYRADFSGELEFIVDGEVVYNRVIKGGDSAILVERFSSKFGRLDLDIELRYISLEGDVSLAALNIDNSNSDTINYMGYGLIALIIILITTAMTMVIRNRNQVKTEVEKKSKEADVIPEDLKPVERSPLLDLETIPNSKKDSDMDVVDKLSKLNSTVMNTVNFKPDDTKPADDKDTTNKLRQIDMQLKSDKPVAVKDVQDKSTDTDVIEDLENLDLPENMSSEDSSPTSETGAFLQDLEENIDMTKESEEEPIVSVQQKQETIDKPVSETDTFLNQMVTSGTENTEEEPDLSESKKSYGSETQDFLSNL